MRSNTSLRSKGVSMMSPAMRSRAAWMSLRVGKCSVSCMLNRSRFCSTVLKRSRKRDGHLYFDQTAAGDARHSQGGSRVAGAIAQVFLEQLRRGIHHLRMSLELRRRAHEAAHG